PPSPGGLRRDESELGSKARDQRSEAGPAVPKPPGRRRGLPDCSGNLFRSLRKPLLSVRKLSRAIRKSSRTARGPSSPGNKPLSSEDSSTRSGNKALLSVRKSLPSENSPLSP